jgi:Flp pilus assembly protein TadG
MTFPRLSPRAHRIQSFRAGLRRDNGAALVEFALSFAVFTAVTVGIIWVCLALYSYEYVDFAAREAARWAAVRGADCYKSSQTMPGCTTAAGATPTDIQQYVASFGYPVFDRQNLNVSVAWLSKTENTNGNAIWVACTPPSILPTYGNGCNTPGDAVQITVSLNNYDLAIPFMGSHVITIGNTAQMVISQ